MKRVLALTVVLPALLLGLVMGVFSGALEAKPAANANVQKAKADHAVWVLLVRQEEVLGKACVTLDNYASGRISQMAALQALKVNVQSCRQIAEAIKARQPALLGASYCQAAGALAQARVSMAAAAEQLAAHKPIHREALNSFQQTQGRQTLAATRVWLQQRLAISRQLSVGGPANLQIFYNWQVRTLPWQLRQIDLAERVSQCLQQVAKQQTCNAAGLSKQGAEICRGLRKVEYSRLLNRAAMAGLEEARSLAALAEAVELLADDYSEEAVSRVNRCSRQSYKCSLQAAQDTVKALGNSL